MNLHPPERIYLMIGFAIGLVMVLHAGRIVWGFVGEWPGYGITTLPTSAGTSGRSSHR